MYAPDSSRFDSPFSASAQAPLGEPLADKIRFFLEDHGKQLLMLLVVLAVAWFAYDFFVGSIQSVTISVKNTENQPVTGTVSVFETGQSNPVKSETTKSMSVQLRNGSYLVRVESSGYESYEGTIVVSPSLVQFVAQLSQPFSTVIEQLDIPSSVYVNQNVSAGVTLYNRGDRDETVELVFEDDLVGVSRFSEGSFVVPARSRVVQNFELLFPQSRTPEDETNGDALKGTIRIKRTQSGFKSASFQLLPSPDVAIRPDVLSKSNLVSGQSLQEIGRVSVKNNSRFPIPAFSVSVSLSDESMADWFSFSKIQTHPLDPRSGALDEDEIIVYISPPALERTISIAGNSSIRVASDVFEKSIPLQLEIEKTDVALTVVLSSDEVTVSLQGDEYEVNLNEEVRLQNKGDVPIANVEVSIETRVCSFGNWVNFTGANRVDSLATGATQSVKLRISAPATAEAGTTQNCRLKVVYENPLTGETVLAKDFDLLVVTG